MEALVPAKGFAVGLKGSSQRLLRSLDLEIGRARKAARAAPRDAARLEALCAALVARGRRQEAVAEAATFLRGNGDAAAVVLGPLFHRLGAAARAIGCYERAHALHPESAEPVCGLGVLAAERGDVDTARAHFERATELAPQDSQPWYRLGSLHLRRRELDAAEKALRRALELDPQHARAQGNLGLLLDLRGERVAAETALQRALTLAPEEAENHFNLGALYAETGRLEQALECFEAGAELQPQSLEGHLNAGRIHLEQGRYDAALQRLARVLALAPGHADALLYTGLCQLRKGQDEKALRALEAAARAGVDSPRLYYAMGQAYVGLDLPHQAVRVLGRLLDRAPDHARGHWLLAVCWDKLGERERASASYHRAEQCTARQRGRAAARMAPPA
jgi:tetratricopeptide (TPR) repeat protein